MLASEKATASIGLQPEVITLKVSRHFMRNYNYLIVDRQSRCAVIVDPAWQMEVIDDALEKTGAKLCGVLVTHSHPDHVHLAKPLAAKYHCPIWMSKREIIDSGFESEQLVGIDSVAWRVGGLLIRPILTPGHTPGCVCYHIGDNLFTGDVLFAEGCGMCPDIEAARAMFASLDHLKGRLSPATRVFPGHSYGRPPGQLFSTLLRENIYLQFTNADTFAAFRLRRNQRAINVFGTH